MAENLGTLIAHLGLDITGLTSGLGKAKSAMSRAGQSMQRVGRNMTTRISAPIAALGTLFAKFAADFQRSLRKINTLVGLSADRLNTMSKQVIALSNQTGRAATELSDALFVVTSAGQRGAEAFEILERSAKASAIGLGDTKEVARTLTAVLNAYGKENISAARAADVLVGIVREGNLVAEELSPVLGRVIGLASQLGISFEEVGGSIATFTRLGVDSAEAVTGLRGIMNSLLKPSEQSAEAFEKAGTSLGELKRQIQEEGLAKALIDLVNQFRGNEEALADIVPNVRALSALLGTAGVQAEGYTDIMSKLNAELNHVDDGFATIAEDSGFIFEQTMQQLKNAALELGQILLPTVNKVLKVIISLTKRFSELSTETKQWILLIGGIVAALGPAIFIIGTFVTILGAILSPIGLVIVGIVALGAAIYVLVRNWELVVDGFIEQGKRWKNNLFGILASVADFFGDLLDLFNEFLMAIGKVPIGNVFDGWSKSLRDSIVEIKAYEGGFVSFTDIVAESYGKLKKVLSTALDFGGSIPPILPTAPGARGPADAATAMGIPDIGRGPAGKIGAPELPSRLKKVSEGIAGVKNQVFALGEAVQNVLNTAIADFATTLADVFTGDAGASGFFGGLLTIISGFLESFGKALIAAGVAALAFETLLINPFAAIAAGVALVTLSRVITNLLKKGPQGMRSGGFVTEGGLFNLHRNEQVALPAGSAVTSARVLGQNNRNNINIIVRGEISSRAIKFLYDEEDRITGNTF